MNRGYLIIEASVSTLILSVALIALLPLFAVCLRASQKIQHAKVATQLSTELLEEIRLHKWDQLTPTPSKVISQGSATLGPDNGETASDKTTFNDIDDFNGWTENTPLDPMMQTLTAFTGYTRTVSVSYVTSSLAASATPTDYKQVHVCTQWPAMPSVCLDSVFTNR